MRLKAVQAFNTPKDACAIIQVRVFIFDVRRHTETKSQLNTPESQLLSFAELYTELSGKIKTNT